MDFPGGRGTNSRVSLRWKSSISLIIAYHHPELGATGTFLGTDYDDKEDRKVEYLDDKDT